MVKGGERMRLAAAELSNQRKDWRRALGLAGEPPENHPGVFSQGARKIGAGEELFGIFIVLGRGAGYDLLEGYGKLVGVKRATFPDFLPGSDYFIPGVH